ncbi:hypothetical protein RIF29_27749 [Crotalaria pallida]|uniref:Homeobox domain-containing protein n=1 Tax=Crotalaria pallida TaxID=3830 RepID=A0AAN9EWW7_CROPI
MRVSYESSSCDAQAIDMARAVKDLQRLTSLDLNKLLRDSQNSTIHYRTEEGLLRKIDMEKLVGSLPLHLIAMLISSDRDEATFRYLLRGIRLLHSLCDLASRNSKVDQIFLDDMKVLEQLIDLVFYMLVVLSGCRQEECAFSHLNLMHSTLVACNFYLLTGFTSMQWQDIANILLAHPKVEVFMDAAFGSVRMVVRCLEISLSAYYKDFSMESNPTAERVVYYLCQQCEASLQFLQSLCQQKSFKERLLNNKELCRNGSIPFLALAILNLDIQLPFPTKIKAAMSRLKAKILSILLSVCEAESISYLDEVARSSESLKLAKAVASLVFELLKTAFSRDPRHLSTDRSHPMGFVHLNAMRLADVFSDDSNFRSYMIDCFTKVLTAVISQPHGGFLSDWCSTNLPDTEEDAAIEYDIFAAVGWVLDNASFDTRNALNLEFNLIPNSMPKSSYAQHRTSLFVKFFANLHCFVPNICKEQERNLFILKVLECLQDDLFSLLPGFSFAHDDAPKAATAIKNLCSLLSHAESLIPNFLNAEDVQLLRVFRDELQSLFASAGFVEKHAQETRSAGKCSSPLTIKEPASLANKGGNSKEGMSENSALPNILQYNSRAEDINPSNDLNQKGQVEDKGLFSKNVSGGARDMDKDAQNIETSGSDASSAKGKNAVGHTDNGGLSKLNEHLKRVSVEGNLDDEKAETVQRRKRKRNIMNEDQVRQIEDALLNEPDMHRNPASLQFWADKLSSHGSEVTASQLKNWLNNRKARLARTAKDPSDLSVARRDPSSLARIASGDTSEPLLAGPTNVGAPEFPKAGEKVMLIGGDGEDVGRGKVFQVHGNWYGKNLEQSVTCVVEVSELKVDQALRLPYPSELAGTSFVEAERKLGVMRVLWDLQRLHRLQPNRVQ